MQKHAAITGWGHYVPETVLTNKGLELLVDTSDDWIQTRTGIHSRRIAGAGETTSSLCIKAAERALECARLPAADLDLVICATTTPDQLLPATGCLVQEKIGAVNAGAFDINSACTGFLYGLVTGVQFIQSGTYQRVLVVAGEVLSRFLNWQDRTTCILHGDGAAAVVLEATPQKFGVLSSVLGSRGDSAQLLTIAAGGSARPASADTVAARAHFVSMRGNEVFKLAIRGMTQAASTALARANVSTSGLEKIIPHQANLRIIRALGSALGLPEKSIYVNVDRYGNTGAASVPLALSEYLDAEAPPAGANLLLVAFGGGLTWASVVLRWADVASIIQEREQRRAVIPVTPLRAVS
jgi:3-oxoacyl-[acyl-carrier-protein] synthase III